MLQRKSHLNVELCGSLVFRFGYFMLDAVKEMRRLSFHLVGKNCFHINAEHAEKIFCCGNALYLAILSKYCSKMRAACAARLGFIIQLFVFLICGVVCGHCRCQFLTESLSSGRF